MVAMAYKQSLALNILTYNITGLIALLLRNQEFQRHGILVVIKIIFR